METSWFVSGEFGAIPNHLKACLGLALARFGLGPPSKSERWAPRASENRSPKVGTALLKHANF